MFVAGDRADYLRAVRAVLADPDHYRASYDRPEPWAGWMWEKQAEVLDGVYEELVRPDLRRDEAGLEGPPRVAEPARTAQAHVVLTD